MNPPERRDPFEALGVDEAASEADVKSAYRRLAKVAHPDGSQGDVDRFRALTEAYRDLLDPARRAEAEAARRRVSKPDVVVAFDDIFDALAESARPDRTRRRKGADIERRLEIGVAEALAGGRHVLRHATGPCSVCGGVGRMRRGVAGVVPCAFCGGDGSAKGGGVEFDLPRGVRSGTKLVVAGGGAPGTAGGRSGDLVVEVVVTTPDAFVRLGEDVETTVVLPVWDAALGTRVQVPTVDGGSVSVSVPPGTQSGTEIVVDGQGMPTDLGRGTMRVVVEVSIPDASSEPYRRLFVAMRDSARLGRA